MPVTESELHLDGNAAAGWLADIFRGEITTAEVTCVSCGREGAVGTLTAYALELGVVLRCPACDQVIMRMTHHRDRYWLDLRGTTTLRFSLPPA